MEQLLTPEDVSETLGVPVKTLYRWRQHGYGPASTRIGRHVRYRAGDVQAFIEDRFAEEASGAIA